jgi:hypothetical protein
MGMFLSMTSVIGRAEDDVLQSLKKYAHSVDGGLETETMSLEDNNCCVIEESNGNSSVFYSYAYLEWDKSSEFISRDLHAPVFSFHVHDGDLWMYVLYFNGEIVDQFNPIPDYWVEDVSAEEMQRWKGNAATVAKYVPSIKKEDIENYLIRWNLEADETSKAYPSDEYSQEDWQLLDFLKKIGLPYPIDDDNNPKGKTFKLWTKELPLIRPTNNVQPTTNSIVASTKKPWWKFW